MEHITGTHFNYYFVCHRKLWLFANHVQMESESDLVYHGDAIHEHAYPQRSGKYEEVQLGGIKVDYYDATDKIIHEVKKSDKIEDAHIWQLKYYIYVFEQAGISGVQGILEYPKLRKRRDIYLTDPDRSEIQEILTDISRIIQQKQIPPVINARRCNACAYHDFCYVQE